MFEKILNFPGSFLRVLRGLREIFLDLRSSALICGFVICLLGCASVRNQPTTRMTVDDFQAMTQAMAQSLLASDALAQRGPNSPPWIVSIQKVTNLTSDVMTQAEQWSIMAQLVGATPIQSLWELKNVRFVLPAQRVAELRQSPNHPALHQDFGARRKPTHVMTAVFRSITRAQAKRRTDLYSAAFEIIDLKTGQLIWQDRFEFKRAAHGSIHD